MSKIEKITFWAGFCDGKIHVFQNFSGANTVELFVNRKHAKKVYQDVRKVEVKEIRSK